MELRRKKLLFIITGVISLGKNEKWEQVIFTAFERSYYPSGFRIIISDNKNAGNLDCLEQLKKQISDRSEQRRDGGEFLMSGSE